MREDVVAAHRECASVCEHVHLPLQSGSTRILKAMRRTYSRERFVALAGRLREEVPGLALTTDVIVGFPGETERQFEETVRLCERAAFSKIHVFPYSPRSGTRAAEWPDDVLPGEKDRRARTLTVLSDRLALEFAHAFVGETVEVLVENRHRRSGLLTGLTDNSLRVQFEGPEEWRGELVPVQVLGAEGDGTVTGVPNRNPNRNPNPNRIRRDYD
jgi:MiaB/RimO family radical SAM methylthiotransferase